MKLFVDSTYTLIINYYNTNAIIVQPMKKIELSAVIYKHLTW